MRTVTIPYMILNIETIMTSLKWSNRCACCGNPNPNSNAKQFTGLNGSTFPGDTPGTDRPPQEGD